MNSVPRPTLLQAPSPGISTSSASEELARGSGSAPKGGHTEGIRLDQDSSADGKFLVDYRGLIVDANPRAELTFGYERSELLGQTFAAIVKTAPCAGVATLGVGREQTLQRKGGTAFFAEVDVTNFTLSGHATQIWTIRDVSTRKAADIERERLLRLVEYASDFVGMADASGRILYQNPAANRMLGFDTLHDVQGKHLSEMHPAWAAAKIAQHALPMAMRDGSYTHETVLLHRDGTEIPVSQTMVIHRNDNGEVEYGSTIMRDLRSQKKAEALLAKVARHVKGMLYQYVRTADGSSHFSYASPGAYELCGLTPEELASSAKAFADRVHPEDLDRVFQAIVHSQDHLTPWSSEYRYIGPDGSVRWHRGQSTPERLPDGGTLWHGFICDVTKEHLAAQELERSKVEFEQAIAALEHGFAMFDADERLIVCNDAYAQMYRVSDATRQLRPRYEDLIRITSSQNPDVQQWLPKGLTFEQWIAKRLLDFRTNTGQSVQQIGNRWIRLDERKTVTGGTVCVRTDITQLKEREFEAVLQQERLRVATRTGGFGVWEWEMADGKITWDARMCELYDYTPDDFPGTYVAWQNRVHAEDVRRVEETFGRSVAERSEFKARYRVVHQDGAIRHIEAQGACVVDAQGNIVRFVGVNSDITEQIEAQEVLKRHAQAAETASKAKAEFLATMSHEIRTPMNGVIGMTNLLIGTELDGQQREYVETIRASGESLLSLINNILDFSKMEAGKLELENVPFQLDQAVVQGITLFTSQAEAKGVQLVHTLPSEPATVVGDLTRFKQILMNLVSNALKFTRVGSVRIDVRVQKTSESRALVELAVADTGIGIAAGHLARLGEAFLQADASTTRQYGGTGLGLSISLGLIQKMNGNISVSSELDVGTTFTVRLPLGIAQQLDAPTEPSLPDAPAIKLGRVLVAEDNAVNQRVVGLMLKKLASHIDFASDGREALKFFTHSAYDCVLMDGQMPEMDGLEATRQMRAFERENDRPKTPIIALTANALPGDRETFLAAGMDEYLTKPVRNSDLLITLKRVLHPPGS